MKQNIYIETKAQSQNQQGIGDAVAGIRTFIRMNKVGRFNPTLPDGRVSLSAHWKKHWGGREGPPGRARSPGITQTHFPDYPLMPLNRGSSFHFANNIKIMKDRPVKAKGAIFYFLIKSFENQYNNEYQYFINKQKTNFFNNHFFNILIFLS